MVLLIILVIIIGLIVAKKIHDKNELEKHIKEYEYMPNGYGPYDGDLVYHFKQFGFDDDFEVYQDRLVIKNDGAFQYHKDCTIYYSDITSVTKGTSLSGRHFSFNCGIQRNPDLADFQQHYCFNDKKKDKEFNAKVDEAISFIEKRVREYKTSQNH